MKNFIDLKANQLISNLSELGFTTDNREVWEKGIEESKKVFISMFEEIYPYAIED